MIQQGLSLVCPRTNNYVVALSCTSVSSFLLRGLKKVGSRGLLCFRPVQAPLAAEAIFVVHLSLNWLYGSGGSRSLCCGHDSIDIWTLLEQNMLKGAVHENG